MIAISSPALSSIAAGTTLPVNQYANNFNLGLTIEVVSGTNTSKVQYTTDNIYDSTVTPQWVDCAAPLTGANATVSASHTIPCTAGGLNMTAGTSGSAFLRVVSSSK